MFKYKPIFSYLLAFQAAAFTLALTSANAAPPDADLSSLVNPFVGTDNGGDTYPGAVAPFGMMQLSPNWDNNGYYYPESKMHGFVVNLLSGDGGANEGQVLLTATTGPVKIDRDSTDYTFNHHNESASAGYYQVLMQPWNINAELTALTHTGYAKFSFPSGKQRNIVLPLSYANDPVSAAHIHVVDSSTITGDVTAHAFNGPGHITVYFVMAFSKPFASHGTWTGTAQTDGAGEASQTSLTDPVIGFYGSYPASKSPQEIDVRIGVSYVDVQGAIDNLQAEMPTNSTFAHYHSLATAAWDKELSVIDVTGGTHVHNKIFYTALYHALIAPEVAEDVNGLYRGFDDQIHKVDAGHTHYYETFSGWDIYRTEIPLFTIIEPSRVQDMAQSIVDMAEQQGYIDRWPQMNQSTYCMNGDPLTVCLCTIYNAGLHGFDVDTAYKYMLAQAQAGDPHSHISVYQNINEEHQGVTLNADVSVSSALEYDVSFAALGHLAVSLGKTDDANYLFGRALQYRDMYNPASGFLQAHLDNGRWDPAFGGYTEGDQWIYLWFVPEDVQGLVDELGGTQTFDKRLDQFFAENHYDPTNEPDLQAPFFYDYISRAWKTQHIVAEAADHNFTDTPGGLAGGGNDDLGTMSSWYILTQLGFYFVDPGIADVEVCTPRFPKAIIHLSSPNGAKSSTFEIDAPAAGAANEYIQSAALNGNSLTKPWFDETEITGGGTWTVSVGASANDDWASSPFDRPYSLSCGWTHTPDSSETVTLIPDGRTNAEEWKYTTDKPADSWNTESFDDSSWKTGKAGFGTNDEGVTPRTPWNTDNIWLRHSFDLQAGYKPPVLQVYHDQSIDVFINGLLAVHVDSYTHTYDPIVLPVQVLNALHVGTNEMAVHVGHPGDGRHYADASLLEIASPDYK